MRLLPVVLALLVGCAEKPEPLEDAGKDAGSPAKDAGGTFDAGTTPADAGSWDAGVVDAGGPFATTLRWKQRGAIGECRMGVPISDGLLACEAFAYLEAPRLERLRAEYADAGCSFTPEPATESALFDCPSCVGTQVTCGTGERTVYSCWTVPYATSCNSWSPP